MTVDKFINHLYKNIWIYIIQSKNFDLYWKHTSNEDYDPGDFESDSICELIKNLKNNFPFQEAYKEVIGSVDKCIRDIIMEFMAWFSYVENFSSGSIYYEVILNGNVDIKPLVDLVNLVENSEKLIIDDEEQSMKKDKLSSIFTSLDKFTSSSKSLTSRRKGKTSLIIEDEYDVQDILHTMLYPLFPTINSEQVVSGNDDKHFLKIDFLIASNKIAIETKYIKTKQDTNKLTKELNDDIQTYYKNQDCNELIFFVYDKDLLIYNPDNLEKQYTISQSFGEKRVNIYLIIRPKN